MASTLGKTSRLMKVAVDSSIQRCSSSRCSRVNILLALSLTGVVKKAVPVSVGCMVVDMGSPSVDGWRATTRVGPRFIGLDGGRPRGSLLHLLATTF